MIVAPFAFLAGQTPPVPVPAPVGGIVTTNLQHWWTCLNPSSMTGTTTWVDLQGNRNLNLSNLSQLSLGGVTTLVGSGGSSQATATVSNTIIKANFTVEAWVYIYTTQTTTNNFPPIFEYGVGGTQGVFSNFRKDRDTLASYNFGSAGWVYDTVDTGDFSRQTWQHLVWAQSSTAMTHYVNASQSYQQSKTYVDRTVSSTSTYQMWRDADRFLNGGIGVVRVYNDLTLSPTQVTNNYNVEKASFGL